MRLKSIVKGLFDKDKLEHLYGAAFVAIPTIITAYFSVFLAGSIAASASLFLQEVREREHYLWNLHIMKQKSIFGMDAVKLSVRHVITDEDAFADWSVPSLLSIIFGGVLEYVF